MPKLSDRIKELRKSAGLTQEEFGQKFGVVKSTVSLYESGKSTPNDEIKRKICEYFNVSLDYLHGLTNRKQSDDASIFQNNSMISTGHPTIAYWIEKTGLDRSAIAKRMGITQDLLEDYMSGVIAPPYNILISLSDICEVSTDCLLGLTKKSREKDFDGHLPFRYNYEIANRIKILCKKADIDIQSSFLENLLSLSEKEVFYLIEYGFVPHVDTIIKLSDFFNVSTDYLLCKVDEQEEKALSSFHNLNTDNQDIIIGEMKKYIREQRLEESVAAEDSSLRKVSGK